MGERRRELVCGCVTAGGRNSGEAAESVTADEEGVIGRAFLGGGEMPAGDHEGGLSDSCNSSSVGVGDCGR